CALVTSARCATALPPSAFMIPAVSSAAAEFKSTQNTLAPSRAKRTAVALPLPQPGPIDPAPTTIATLPLSRSGMLCPHVACRIWSPKNPLPPTLPPKPGVPGFGNNSSVDIGNIRCRPRGRVDTNTVSVGVGRVRFTPTRLASCDAPKADASRRRLALKNGGPRPPVAPPPGGSWESAELPGQPRQVEPRRFASIARSSVLRILP